jgi:urea transport system permease protein
MQPSSSIEMVVWVAVGGRGTLVGAIIGALIVNGAKSWLTVQYPELWLYALGLIFIVTTLFLPKGVAGLREFRISKLNLTPWRAVWKRT